MEAEEGGGAEESGERQQGQGSFVLITVHPRLKIPDTEIRTAHPLHPLHPCKNCFFDRDKRDEGDNGKSRCGSCAVGSRGGPGPVL